MPIKYSLVALMLLCACTGLSPSAQGHSDLKNSIEFRSDDSSEHLVLPNKESAGRIWRDDSHAGLTVTDCSNTEWHCVTAGVISILAPKNCNSVGLTEWSVGDISAKKIQNDGDIFYYYTRNKSLNSDFINIGASGFIYSKVSGIVGIWYSKEAMPDKLDMRAITKFWIVPGSPSFMRCGSQ